MRDLRRRYGPVALEDRGVAGGSRGSQSRCARRQSWIESRVSRRRISVALGGRTARLPTALQPPPHLLTTLPAPAGGGRRDGPRQDRQSRGGKSERRAGVPRSWGCGGRTTSSRGAGGGCGSTRRAGRGTMCRRITAPLKPYVSGDGDHGVSVERGDARARPADLGARVAQDDEALRPDGGHGNRRRDRTHRDLTRPGKARERPPLTQALRATAPTAPGPPVAKWTASGRSASGASRWRLPCVPSASAMSRTLLPSASQTAPDSPLASAPGSWPPSRDRHVAGVPARQSATARLRAALRSPVGGTPPA